MVWIDFPVHAILGTLLLYRILEISGVYGVLVMILLLLQRFKSMACDDLASACITVIARDARFRTINDVLSMANSLQETSSNQKEYEMKELRSPC
jgi:hypothetical protein